MKFTKTTHQAFILSLSLILLIFSCPSQVLASTPSVQNHTTNSNQVGRYQKFEVTFSINRTYPEMSPVNNPPIEALLPYYYYNPQDTIGQNGITINGHFTAPSGKILIQPAFYYQDYFGTGTYSWKLRFAPEETGNYNYFITIEDREGTTRYPTNGSLSFTATNSSSKGFIRVSPRDSRFFEFDNGKSFIPIGGGHQWWECCGLRVSDYVNTFSQYGAHGINFTRIWDQNDGYALTVEGHFDAYSWPDDYNPTDNNLNTNIFTKGTQMNQRGNQEEDQIIEAAEKNGIYIQLCSHENPYWIWDNYDTNSTSYLNYWKRNFRYRVARWGYSTSIMAWERWNEHGHIPTGSDIYNFYQTYAAYQEQVDPYHHLRTTSQGSQSYSPGFWSSKAMDYGNYHDYMMSSRYNVSLVKDAAYFIYLFSQCLGTSGNCSAPIGDGSSWTGGQKPFVWGELDTGTTEWNEANPQPIADHNAIWAGLFSRTGMVPLDWYWSNKDYLSQIYDHKKIASDFFSNIDYAGERFTHLATDDVRDASITGERVTTTNNTIRTLALRSSDQYKTYLWVQNKNHTWGGSANPSAISGTITIPKMNNGTYNLEYWNTETGAITRSTATTSNNQLNISINNLSKDTAIKAIHSSAPTTTQSPSTPTATPTTTSIPGDANGDGKVDGIDYIIWLNNYNTNTQLGASKGDFNKDGKVDGIDYIIWLNNY